MPMIDVVAREGTFVDKHRLAVDLATTAMRVEGVPDIPMFRNNTAAFVHEMDGQSLANVNGDNNYVRIQVLTNAAALTRDKQIEVVQRLTAVVISAAGDPSLIDRTWVLLTEAPDGGWGLHGARTSSTSLSRQRERS